MIKTVITLRSLKRIQRRKQEFKDTNDKTKLKQARRNIIQQKLPKKWKRPTQTTPTKEVEQIFKKAKKINISKESSKQNAENQSPEKTTTHFSTQNNDFENFLRIRHATITNHDWLHHLRCPGPLQIHILSFYETLEQIQIKVSELDL